MTEESQTGSEYNCGERATSTNCAATVARQRDRDPCAWKDARTKGRLRQQRRQRAAELVRIGLTHKQIAERLGIAVSTVAELLAEGSGGFQASVTQTQGSG